MKKVNKHFLFLFLVLALLAMSTTVVFAKELGLLTISGPGIKGELTLNDHDDMMNLEQSGFFDQAMLSKAPQGLDGGYTITAHLNLDGQLVPFIEMIYYPTNEDQSSYVHYTGRLEGETLRTVDEWYILNRKADSVLRELMTANNISIQSALIQAPEVAAPVKEPATAVEPVTASTTSTAPAQAPYLIPALVVSILALMGLALLVRRRAVSHPTV